LARKNGEGDGLFRIGIDAMIGGRENRCALSDPEARATRLWDGRGTTWALALLAAGASRTYRRAFPAATGLSGTSGALESLDGNPYPPIHA